MKQQLKFLILTCFTLTFSGCESLHRTGEVGEQQEIKRIVQNFAYDWQFRRENDPQFPPGKWINVFLPHTVKEEPLVVNDQWQGISRYKKEFPVAETGAQKWFFEFEGVMQVAKISINNSLVKVHKGGYLPLTVDATPFLKENTQNTIEVEVTNTDDATIPPGKPLKELDFNYYGGIYRPVYLVKTPLLHITDPVYAEKVNSGGILIHFSEVSQALAKGSIQTHVRNDSEAAVEFQVRTSFTSKSGKKESFSSETVQLPSGIATEVEQQIIIENPDLWSTVDPELYELEVALLKEGKVIDSKQLNYGIRDIRLTGDGFYLNGEKLFLNGTNRHQEYPYVGYAISKEANYRDAYKIKEAGFNLVRLSHYPQASAFLEACDELGLLVMNCIPGWQYFGEEEFQERALQDIREMVRRDRHHPSVVFWENSLNESGMSEEFIVKANEVLHAELPYDDTYSAGWIDHPAYDLFTPARQHAKPPHYWNQYDEPDRPIFIAEYGDWGYYAQNAGFNQTAFQDLKAEERTSRQLRSAGEKRLLQQAYNFQESFNSNLKGAQTIGMANWLMFDYNRGYADDIESSGISDIFRIPKFTYYFYKSQKDPFLDEFSEPMVFIASYWQPDSSEKITVFSNTEEVALYLNGDLVAKNEPVKDEFSDELPHSPFYFQIPEFVPGQLKAVGFIDGEKVAEHIVETPAAPSKIALSVDFSAKPISADSPDIVFVYAKILDANGNLAHSAENEVGFTLEGASEGIELVGENPITAEAGIATILLRTRSLSEDIIIKAQAEGLEADEMLIEK